MFRCFTAMILVVFLTMGNAMAGPFLKGADISFLPQVESGGGVFKAGGVSGDLLDILAAGDVNTVRLRLWHSPADGHSGLAETVALALRAKASGLDFLLDFHYSDTWADPANQTKPAAWAGLDLAALTDSVYSYTRDVLTAFDAAGATPDFVQIGNEITPGMLWNEGRVGGSFDTPAQWPDLATLIGSAVAGVDDALPTSQRPEIMIHIDRGADNSGARWFFDNLLAQGVEFDMIGLSYYPWWHGSLADLENNLNDLATRYGKDLVIVETAYPWTLGWFDDTHNMVGLPEHLLPGYSDTPEGQRDFLAAIMELVFAIPEGRGRGVFWWAPDWITSPGFGSSWENLALFDENGDVLPALDAFRVPSEVKSPPLKTGLRLSPNPFGAETTIYLDSLSSGEGWLEIFDLRGRLLEQRVASAGDSRWTWRPCSLAAGTYFFRLTTADRQWNTRATLVR